MYPNRTMPKSLHTVSAIVAVALDRIDIERHNTGAIGGSAGYYVRLACAVLGLDTMDDAYNLKAQAVAKLRKMGV